MAKRAQKADVFRGDLMFCSFSTRRAARTFPNPSLTLIHPESALRAHPFFDGPMLPVRIVSGVFFSFLNCFPAPIAPVFFARREEIPATGVSFSQTFEPHFSSPWFF